MAYFDRQKGEIILSDEDKEIFKQCKEYVDGLKPDWMDIKDFEWEIYQAQSE